MAVNFLKNLRKGVGNAVDLTGRTLSALPIPGVQNLASRDFGISEAIAGGRTATTGVTPVSLASYLPNQVLQSVAPLGMQGNAVTPVPDVLGARTGLGQVVDQPQPLASVSPFQTALGSAKPSTGVRSVSGAGSAASGQAAQVDGSQDIRILNGQAFNILDPQQAQAYYAGFNQDALNQFESTAAGKEAEVRRNIEAGNLEAARALRNISEGRQGLAAKRTNFLSRQESTRGDINKGFSLGLTRSEGQYAANPLLQSSQGVSKYLIEQDKNKAMEELERSGSQTMSEYDRQNRGLEESEFDVNRQVQSAAQENQAALEAINARRREVAANASKQVLGDVVSADLNQGRSLDLSRYLNLNPQVTDTTVDLSKFGALSTPQLQQSAGTQPGVGAVVATPTQTPEDLQRQQEEEKKRNINNFLELGYTR